MEEGAGDTLGIHRPRNEVFLKIVEVREMSDFEVEAVASLLFSWWKRDYERERDEAMQGNQEKE